VTHKTARKPTPRDRTPLAAANYMQMLREDHAGLSRVLREIDAQQSLLQVAPVASRPVLTEALRYLLVYQHSIHHRREDLLFARVRARQPRLYANLRQLVREHRVDRQQVERIVTELSMATLAQLRGRTGQRLALQLRKFVQHSRDHMRREEVVFYCGCERVLRTSDWKSLLAEPMPRAPISDPARFAVRYPRLAERLSRPQRAVTGPLDSAYRTDLRARAERVVERCAALLHHAIDLAQSVLRTTLRG
jgi:hemerythrin-like domain-containing protein